MSRCFECGGRIRRTRVRHRLKESGLPEVIVSGVIHGRCRDCGEMEIGFPRMGPLFRTIALALAFKETPLRGGEARFLRGHLGWSGSDFAANMGVSRETVSRWEHDRLRMGASAERLLRLMVVLEEPGTVRAADVLRFPSRKGGGPLRLRLSLRRGIWHTAAA